MKKDKDIKGKDPFGPIEGRIITYKLLCGRKYDQNTYEHYIIGPPNNLLVPNCTARDYIPKTVGNNGIQMVSNHFMHLRHLVKYIDYRLSKIYGLYKFLSERYANNLMCPLELSSINQYSTQEIILNMAKFIELFTHEIMEPYTGEITKKYKFKDSSCFIKSCANAYKHTWINSSSTFSLFGESMPMVNAVYEPRNTDKYTIKKFMSSLPAVVIAFRDIYECWWLDKTNKYKHKLDTKPWDGLIKYAHGSDEFFTRR